VGRRTPENRPYGPAPGRCWRYQLPPPARPPPDRRCHLFAAVCLCLGTIRRCWSLYRL